MDALEGILTPMKGCGIVDWMGSSYGKLKESMYSCGTNRTWGVCFNDFHRK